MRVATVVMALLLVVAGTAVAQKVEDPADDQTQMRTDCNVDYYTAYSHAGGEIPDDDGGGVMFGPIQTPAGDVLEDVVLFVNMEHTWVGDLRLWLLYDHECDGSGDIVGQVLCRPGPGVEGCEPDGCCGCGGNFAGWYAFDDGAPSIQDECPLEYVSGCYGPDWDSIGLDVFNCAASGGCFWLFVADGAGSDVGVVHEWVVNVLYESTPVEPSSWGSVKALFR